MASIKKRPDGQWRARYRDAAGREHARHFVRKVDGQQWLDQVTASVQTGTYIDPKAGRVTLAEYAAGWEAAQVGRPATLAITDNALRLHILPALGSRPVQSVLRSDVQALIKALSEQLAPGSVRNIYDTLTRLYGAAVDDRVTATSPCRRITLPAVSDAEVVPPTAEQVAARAAAVPARYRALVVLLAGSGLRIGEGLGLDLPDIDFLRRTVRVNRQRLQNGRLAPPKTSRSERTVPVGDVVIEELAAHLQQWPAVPGALFTAGGGQPLRYGEWKRIWTRAQPADEELDTHDLRHYFASGLISGGASVKAVQTVLGHASPVVTLRVYSHLWPGDEDRVRSISDSNLEMLRTSRGLVAL